MLLMKFGKKFYFENLVYEKSQLKTCSSKIIVEKKVLHYWNTWHDLRVPVLPRSAAQL